MDRSRRTSSRGREDGTRAPAELPVPAESRLTLGGVRRNKRRTAPLRQRLPAPIHVADACGRALRRAAPAMLVVVVAGAVGGGVYAGYRFLTTSPRFAVTAIEVRGAATLSADQVRAIVPVRLGDNVFTTNLDRIEATLEAEPWIADAEVRRRLPHTIEIEVRERQAAALVEIGGLYLADEAGNVFKRARLDLGEGAALPVVTGLERDDLGVTRADAAARIRHALATLASWTDDATRPAIGEVRVDGRHGITLFTYDDAVAISLGEAEGERLATRLATFDAAWASLTPEERRRTRAVHLDHDTRPDHVTVAFNQ